jgi:hypothetical protein
MVWLSKANATAFRLIGNITALVVLTLELMHKITPTAIQADDIKTGR